MAKKLLKEAQVRRFMGLAGMQSNLVSNTINEMYGMDEEEEDMADAEAPMDAGMEEPMDAEMPPAEMEMDAPGEVDLSQDEIEAAAEAMDALQSVMDKLSGAAGEEEPAADMEEPMDAPEMEMDAEEPPAEEEAEEEPDMLEGVELELSEEEIVAEVARRVAKRIMEAKRAQRKMNEALGRKK
jgi:hypothetical protein